MYWHDTTTSNWYCAGMCIKTHLTNGKGFSFTLHLQPACNLNRIASTLLLGLKHQVTVCYI
ncbi:Uncharacterised protein [Mycobacteroides abscessus subsp. abscessus]|nr:Uncharacterised protein [Mycobacteroides abscessus subsp. abscessus]